VGIGGCTPFWAERRKKGLEKKTHESQGSKSTAQGKGREKEGEIHKRINADFRAQQTVRFFRWRFWTVYYHRIRGGTSIQAQRILDYVTTPGLRRNDRRVNMGQQKNECRRGPDCGRCGGFSNGQRTGVCEERKKAVGEGGRRTTGGKRVEFYRDREWEAEREEGHRKILRVAGKPGRDFRLSSPKLLLQSRNTINRRPRWEEERRRDWGQQKVWKIGDLEGKNK